MQRLNLYVGNDQADLLKQTSENLQTPYAELLRRMLDYFLRLPEICYLFPPHCSGAVSSMF